MIECVDGILDNQYTWASSVGGHVSGLDQAYDGGSVNACLGFASVVVLAFVLILLLGPDSSALHALTDAGAGFLLAWFAIRQGIRKSWAMRADQRLRSRFTLGFAVGSVLVLGGTLLALHWGLATGNVEAVTNAGLFLAGSLIGLTATVAYHTQRGATLRLMQLASLRFQHVTPSNRAFREDFRSHLPASSNPPPKPESTRIA